MEKFRLICGIDVSKSTLAVAILQAGSMLRQQTYSNDRAGIDALCQTLAQWETDPSQILVCLEHTGVYIEKLTELLSQTEHFVWVVNPLVIKYARVSFERLKTDAVDARKIARFAHMMQARAQQYQPLKAQQRQIKDLFRLRRQLVKLAQQVKNFAATNLDKAQPDPLTQVLWNQLKAQLQQMKKQVEAQLEQLTQQDDQTKRLLQILRSIPGVGPVCAWQLIYTTQHFQRFRSHKQFAAYAGTAPFEQQSGSSINKKARVSKKANREIKTNLTLAALRQTQKNMVFHQYYLFMKNQQRKPHLWIINSIRNMIIKLAFDLVKKNQLFDREIFLKNKTSWQKHLNLS